MWRAVMIHERAGSLDLGTFRGWREALERQVGHVGIISPGRYRLEEVGVDRVGDTALVFAVLKHPKGGWILNALGPGEASLTLEEVVATLRGWGLERERWVWLTEVEEEVEEVG